MAIVEQERTYINHLNSGWTEERVDRLKILWADGNTADQIAGMIGGISRNAVISKVHRLGITKREKVKSRSQLRGGGTPKGVKKPRHAPRQPRLVLPADTSLSQYFDTLRRPDHLGLTLQQLKDDKSECRYIHGDNKDAPYTFCAQPVDDGSSYCKYHHMICGHRPEPRKAAA